MWIRLIAVHRPIRTAVAFVPNTRTPVRRPITAWTSTSYPYPSNHYCHQEPPALTPSLHRLYSSQRRDDLDYTNHNEIIDDEDLPKFNPGEKVLVEVVSFGPLGASVHVVVAGSHAPQDLPPEDAEWPILGVGLITQQELAYFRDSRDTLEVVLGEVLPAYIERIRDTDGKMAIALRAFGGRAKARDVGQQILDVLAESDQGVFPLGDKSSPADIAQQFPGVSKSTFKKALSALYKQGAIDKPQANEIRLLPTEK
ncbi:Rna binding s1 [Seminavis robusta]|uniref:Rna binding s1 n=1 Tax=Seminavis robusta TaxID=568900 RepID=A0A9N8E0L8_9STRA|nr:Rna binding s1 [Seminavis robusta]|eukprot:Sro390_g133000.1 Rna binding s1 (255) ;mRNA; f:68031-68795